MCGALIGLVCGGDGARRPRATCGRSRAGRREALRQLLDPDDLVQLGAAVRTRTTNLFEGIFEPAPPPKPPPTAPPSERPPTRAAPPTEAAPTARQRRRAPRPHRARRARGSTRERPIALELRTLAIALLASLLLWNLPFGGVLLYPFKLLATWLHELSHGARDDRSPAPASTTS